MNFQIFDGHLFRDCHFMLKRFHLALRQFLFVAALLGLACSTTANAQSGDGVIGWVPVGASGTYSTAYEACRAEWLYYTGGGPQTHFYGATPDPDNWAGAQCEWDGDLILPAGTSFLCASGYTPTVDGHCRKDPPVERPCGCPQEVGRTNPTVGNPIVLSSGAKYLTAEDYSTVDGKFSIGREYRSFQVGRPIDATRLPRSLPRWLAGGWNFDFGYEIQLGTFSGSPSAPNAKVAVLAPDGTGFGFVLQADGQWIPDPSAGAANTPNYLKLEFVGTLPSNLSTIKSAVSNWKIVDAKDTAWTLQTRIGPNGGSYDTAWPTQKVARDGYTWNFAYDADSSLASITDSFGRSANFIWYQFYIRASTSPPAGSRPYPQAVASITLPDGTSLKYTYDPEPATSAPSTSVIKRLIKVDRLSAANAVLDSTTYLYEDPRFPTHITGVIDNRAIRVRTYAYDSQGRATTTQLADEADAYTVEYGVDGTARTRRVTNALGKAQTYTFSAFSGGPADYRLTGITGEASANTATSTSSTSFGTDTFVSSETDEEGHVTTTTRDARGRATSVVEGYGTPSARTTTTTWHSTLNVPVSIARPGLTETRTYNTIGQLTALTLTDTTAQSVPYSTNGQVRTWTYGWDTSGHLLSANGPLAADAQNNDDVTNYIYGSQGNLLTVTDALGHVTTFASYDANGRPGTMTDANGIVTAYTYDGMGRVQTVTVQHPSNPALNATTSISYDAVGNVTGVTLPSTDALVMDYDDANRFASMRAASGERWDYSYDAMGNVASETVKRSDGSTARNITRAFDELGRLIRQTTGAGHTARWSYDKVGNVVSSISPNGQATTAAFDALNRVTSAVAPDTGTTSLAYDARDNLISHTDPITVTTQFTYNGFGDVIQEVSPDRGTSIYIYDAAGRVTESTDGRGQVVDYTRDYLGRVISKLPQGRAASEAVTYFWDADGLSNSYAMGRLAKVVDGSGTTLFQYDHRGNLLTKQQTIGATSGAQLAYQYDLADRVTQIAYPSGRLVQYGYDSKGRVNLVETKASASTGSWTTLASGLSYEPFGSVKAMTLSNGLAVANDWGDDGRLASRRLYKTADGTNLSYLSYRYDADDNIAAITDNVTPANSVLHGYDSVGRLTQTVADGGTAGTESYAYASGTNRLASVTNASGTRTIAYDARGNTASEARPNSVSVATDYDGYGRLTGYNRSNVDALSFAYNGLDDRVAMAHSTDTRHFVYGADGRVLGEYGNSVADAKAEFIWLDPSAASHNVFGGNDGVGGYAPLAVATPDALGAIQVNWVHGNHLGVPLVTTDSGGNLASTPNDYRVPGFPGQSRVFSDLYYNRYRDYDPTTGRYVQADPIGLEGGSNPYLYAGGNPIRFIDPDGRNPAAAGVLLCDGPQAVLCAGGAAILGCLAWEPCRNAFVPKDPPRQPPRYPPKNPPRNPSCNPDDEDPCEIQHDEDIGRCTKARIMYGPAGFAQCASSALRRRTQCKKGQQLEPLTGVDRPLYRD
jgi:RHS repeat-associated core domain